MFLVGTEPHVFPFSRGQELVGDHTQWIIEISPSSLALPHNPRKLPRGLLDTCFFQPPFSSRSQSPCRKELKHTAIAALLSVALCTWMFQTCEFRSQKWQFPQEDRRPSRVSEFNPIPWKNNTFCLWKLLHESYPESPYTWPIEPIISHHWLIWGFLKSPVLTHGFQYEIMVQWLGWKGYPQPRCEMIRSTFSQSQFHATSWSMFLAVSHSVSEVWTWISIRYIYIYIHRPHSGDLHSEIPEKWRGETAQSAGESSFSFIFPAVNVLPFQIRAGAFKSIEPN